MEDLSAFSPRLRLLLDHFSKIKDTRQVWKVAYPLCLANNASALSAERLRIGTA